MEEQKTLILIDGHALAFRQFFALERTNMKTSGGTPTWAVFGFFKAVFDLLKNKTLKPDAICVAFDVSHDTFRVEKYPEYKANREAMPDAMRVQMDLIYEGLDAFNIPVYTKPGYEADDVIGTISKRACELGHKVLILTGDQDSFQLVDKEGCVKVIIPAKGELTEYDWEKVHEKQLAFHRSLKRNRWVFGGNRSGKTECGAVETVWMARGIHPYRPNRPDVSGWVVSVSYDVQREVAQSKILHYLRPDWIEDVIMHTGAKGNPSSGIIDTIVVRNVFGGFSNIGWNSLFLLLPIDLFLIILLYRMRWQIQLLVYGKEADSLGIHSRRIMIIVLILASLLISSVIAAAGIVSWVGLLVPHLIRLAFHRDFTSGFLLNLFGGAAFLLICDTMARCLFPIEIPISIITSLLGAPFLFWMMCRRREGL